MSAVILDGRAIASELLSSLKADVQKLNPKLVIVQVGEDPASASYIKQKIKACAEVGMRNEHIHLPTKCAREDLMRTVTALNQNPDVTGFIVQLPLPPHLTAFVPELIDAIDPKKTSTDSALSISATHSWDPSNCRRQPRWRYPYPGILGHRDRRKARGGRWTQQHCGKTSCDHALEPARDRDDLSHQDRGIRTKDEGSGHPHRSGGKAENDHCGYGQKGAVVIDVGMNRTEEGLIGDVDFKAVKEIASAITPVPGGVGPMTVASLIKNCVTAKKLQAGRSDV